MKENFYRDKSKTNYLNMLNSGKPKKNSRGEIVKDAVFQKRTCAPVSTIPPSRTWFQGTRTVTQYELDNFRKAVSTPSPYTVLLSKGKVPYSLLGENVAKKRRVNDYDVIFGKKATRKRPILPFSSLHEMIASKREAVNDNHESEESKPTVKGQSKRIWNELYKVIDSSDVIIHVLDARDPIGTKCLCIEKHIKENAPHKHMIYVLNKVDLVPTSVTAKWMKVLSRTHPTVAYHSNSITHFYGKMNLTNLLRQYAKLHKEKPQISVGFVGYPNTGKSSIINTLRSKVVCNVAPIPGQTKVWQYITLTKRIYLIDCPGIVPPISDADAVLRGVIRVENIEDPDIYVEEIVIKARDSLKRVYEVEFEDCNEFLEKIGLRYGRLKKNAEVNIEDAARIVLHDWIKGKIPFYMVPSEDGDGE
jgi:nuclear GTP-binding protein